MARRPNLVGGIPVFRQKHLISQSSDITRLPFPFVFPVCSPVSNLSRIFLTSIVEAVDGRDPRAALARGAAERGLSLAALSAAIRRNPAYLHQYLMRGSPRALAESDRRTLAAMLGLSEEALGGPPGPEPAFSLPRLDVEASAGPGAYADSDLVLGIDAVDPRLARALRLRPGQAGLITVRGDSMEPQLNDGDQLIVDTSDRRPAASARVYVIRVDGALMVKRVSAGRTGLVAASDNVAAPPVPEGEIEVVGRAVWRMGAPR